MVWRVRVRVCIACFSDSVRSQSRERRDCSEETKLGIFHCSGCVFQSEEVENAQRNVRRLGCSRNDVVKVRWRANNTEQKKERQTSGEVN